MIFLLNPFNMSIPVFKPHHIRSFSWSDLFSLPSSKPVGLYTAQGLMHRALLQFPGQEMPFLFSQTLYMLLPLSREHALLSLTGRPSMFLQPCSDGSLAKRLSVTHHHLYPRCSFLHACVYILTSHIVLPSNIFCHLSWAQNS